MPPEDRAHHRRRFSGRDPEEGHRGATPLELLYDLTLVVAFGVAVVLFGSGQSAAEAASDGWHGLGWDRPPLQETKSVNGVDGGLRTPPAPSENRSSPAAVAWPAAATAELDDLVEQIDVILDLREVVEDLVVGHKPARAAALDELVDLVRIRLERLFKFLALLGAGGRDLPRLSFDRFGQLFYGCLLALFRRYRLFRRRLLRRMNRLLFGSFL